MRESFKISDPRSAAVFAAARQRKIVLSLIHAEHSLSQLSRLIEMPLNLLHHHMKKLLRLGLVTVARKEVRSGAPIKYYRAVARSFFVPAEWVAPDLGAGPRARLNELLARSRTRTLQGVTYSHEGGGPRMRWVRSENAVARAGLELWMEFRLSDSDAARLATELRDVLHRFEARSGNPGRRYLVHAAVAPESR